jgi:hypothetical protein
MAARAGGALARALVGSPCNQKVCRCVCARFRRGLRFFVSQPFSCRSRLVVPCCNFAASGLNKS